MTKRKEEIKKPDIFTAGAQSALAYVQSHLKYVIIAVAICCVVALSVFAYGAYGDRKNTQAQSTISEGVKSLESFKQSGKKEDLDKAESLFQKVVKEKPGRIYMVAELYLATVYTLKGRTNEAKAIYESLSKKGPAVVQMLSQRDLASLESK